MAHFKKKQDLKLSELSFYIKLIQDNGMEIIVSRCDCCLADIHNSSHHKYRYRGIMQVLLVSLAVYCIPSGKIVIGVPTT